MRTVLLTGASGFLGTNILLKLIDENVKIFALVHRKQLQVKNDKIKVLHCPIEFVEQIKADVPKEIDCIIHCAGLTKSSNIYEFYRVNYIGTAKLLRFIVNEKIAVGHFIHISSIAAVGPQKYLQPSVEETEPRPIAGYGESKLLAEKEVNKYSLRINWTIIRPPFIFGPYDYDTLHLFKMVKSGIKLYLGNKYFSFVYSEDLAEATVKIIGNSKTFGQVYFFSHPEYTTQKEFLEGIARFVNTSAVYVRIHPNFLLWSSYILSPFLNKSTPINRIKFREIKEPYWICSSLKIKNTLGLQAKTSLLEAIERTYKWYNSNKLI